MCVEKDLVMVTYDAFNQKLENPKSYMLFYDYFLRAVVGHETFERIINKQTKDKDCFGTPTDHGFAHLMVKNNQDEWEEKMKTQHKSFLTMHDDESKVKNKKTIVDHLFPSVEFDDNINFINGVNNLSIADKARKVREKAMRKYAREHKALRKISKEIWLNANRPTEDNENSESEATSEPPRKKKKLSTWKPYTNMTCGRRRYAGYSLKAHELIQQVACDVRIKRKEKEEGYNKFENLFHKWKRDGSKKTKGDNDGEFFKNLDKEQSWDF
jgi:hypothetical protein